MKALRKWVKAVQKLFKEISEKVDNNFAKVHPMLDKVGAKCAKVGQSCANVHPMLDKVDESSAKVGQSCAKVV